jgi:hypothetical protein
MYPEDGLITLWVIYRNPSDYPGKFVVRQQWAARGGVHTCVDPHCITSSLIEARNSIPLGLYNIGRMEGDEPQILEVWL